MPVVLFHVGVAPIGIGLLIPVTLAPNPRAIAPLGLGAIAGGLGETPELANGHRILADGVVAQGDIMDRSLVVQANTLRAAHAEGAAGEPDHLRAVAGLIRERILEPSRPGGCDVLARNTPG
jgi:hypothetical protein